MTHDDVSGIRLLEELAAAASTAAATMRKAATPDDLLVVASAIAVLNEHIAAISVWANGFATRMRDAISALEN